MLMALLKNIKLYNLFLAFGIILISTFSTACGTEGTGAGGDLDYDAADYEVGDGNVAVDYDGNGTAADTGADGADAVDTGGGDTGGSVASSNPSDPFDIPITIAKSEKPDYEKVRISYVGNKMMISCTADCVPQEYDTVILYINGTTYYILVNPDGSFSATFELPKIVKKGSDKITIAIAVYSPEEDVIGEPIIIETDINTGKILFYAYDGTVIGASSLSEFSKVDSFKKDEMEPKSLPSDPKVIDNFRITEVEGKIDNSKDKGTPDSLIKDKSPTVVYKNPSEKVVVQEPYSPVGVKINPEVKVNRGTKVLEPVVKEEPSVKAEPVKKKQPDIKVELQNADTLLVHFTDNDSKKVVEVKKEQVDGQITAVQWKSEQEVEVTVQKQIGSVTQKRKITVNPVVKGS